MVRPLICLVFWLITTSSEAFGISFHAYHGQEEIRASLLQLARQNPNLVHFHTLGYSEQGRNIDYVVVSHGEPESLPAIYINGTHHGDEKASTEGVLGLIDYLVKSRQLPVVRELLSNYAIYLQPLVNPDGHAANRRFDARGLDPNRDYAYPGRRDQDSFKTPAIRLVRDLTNRVRFRAALALHSGMEGVLWAWAHSAERPADFDVFFTLAKLTAQAMGMSQYRQSYSDYPALGEFIDYAYMTHGTLAMTVEVANNPTPPAEDLDAVVKRAVAGSVSFMLGIMDLDRGELSIIRNSSTRKDIIPWARTNERATRQGLQ